MWWYGVDEDGRWLYNHGARRLVKGSGKSPFAAVFALIEFVGPCRVADIDGDRVLTKPVDLPLVEIAATAESQTANTMRMVRAMAKRGSRVVAEYELDPGKTKFYRPDGGELHVITSSATAAEGAEVTAAVGDEALALGTMIPTPYGWTTVGQVRVGDIIYGSSGPVTVTHLTPVFTGRPCYRVTFEDGTHLVVDEGHLWQVKVVGGRATRKPKVLTTRQLVEDGRKFSVPRMAPFDGPDLEIPIDPYVLGAWLGDGTSRWAALTVADADLDFILDTVRVRGVPAAKATKYGERAVTVSLQGNARGDLYTKDGSSVRGALVKLGVLGNKHIPPALLRASLSQRLDLLRGLMDTDGWAGDGRAVFVNANRRLADDVAQLIRTLGYTAHISSRADTRWPANPVIYKVSFRPDSDRNPFLIPRKSDKMKPTSLRRHKSIVSIEPVESQPVRCIEVDSDDHLFVAGDGWTLTHNTEHWLPSNGGPDLAAVLDRNLGKSGSRMWETSNAWDPGAGSVAESTWDAWVAQQEGRTKGSGRTLYDAVIAPHDTDLADDQSLLRALDWVYEDCDWVDRLTIRDRIWDLRTKPADARKFYLNQPTAPTNAWLREGAWGAIADPMVVPPGTEIALFFDGSKSGDATALMAAVIESGDVFTVDVWEPEDGENVPVREVDVALARAFDLWRPLGFFADVREWEDHVKTTWPDLYADRLIVWAESKATKDPQPIAWDMRGKSWDFTKAVELCEAEILAGGFRHDGDSRVARHVANARRRGNRYGYTLAKESPKSAKKIDAAICVVGVRMVRRLVLAELARGRPKRPARVVGF
jgi:hypothetical protein